MDYLTLATKAWLLPATILVPWTLLTVIGMHTLPLNREVPVWVGANVAMLMYNPKDNYLYRRPDIEDGLLVLGTAFFPLVNWLVLLFQLWVVGWLTYERIKARFK